MSKWHELACSLQLHSAWQDQRQEKPFKSIYQWRLGLVGRKLILGSRDKSSGKTAINMKAPVVKKDTFTYDISLNPKSCWKPSKCELYKRNSIICPLWKRMGYKKSKTFRESLLGSLLTWRLSLCGGFLWVLLKVGWRNITLEDFLGSMFLEKPFWAASFEECGRKGLIPLLSIPTTTVGQALLWELWSA